MSPPGPKAAGRALRGTLGGLSYVDRLKFKDIKKRSGAARGSSGDWKARAQQEFVLLRLADTLLGASDKDIETYLTSNAADARSMEQFTALLEQYVQLRGSYRDGERMMNEAIERILAVIGRYVDGGKARPRLQARNGSTRKANSGS
jgi:hypothetical protein